MTEDVRTRTGDTTGRLRRGARPQRRTRAATTTATIIATVTAASFAAMLAAMLAACAGANNDDGPGLGETGTGGGTVFYVSTVPFACGERLEKTCTRLEVSPPEGEQRLTWSGPGNHAVDVEDAEHTGIGTGAANTAAIAALTDDEPRSSAAAWAQAYEHGGKDDWYLPAKEELEELCKYANDDTVGNPDETCDPGTLLAGFASDDYWSSTEIGPEHASITDIHRGGTGTIRKTSSYLVRPIRAF